MPTNSKSSIWFCGWKFQASLVWEQMVHDWLPCTWPSQGCMESTLCPNPGEVWANGETAAQAIEMVRGWSTRCLTALGLFSLFQEKGRLKRYLISISHCPACAHRDDRVRLFPEVWFVTWEFLDLTPGRQDVGPNDKKVALYAFSFVYIATSFPFVCWWLLFISWVFASTLHFSLMLCNSSVSIFLPSPSSIWSTSSTCPSWRLILTWCLFSLFSVVLSFLSFVFTFQCSWTFSWEL